MKGSFLGPKYTSNEIKKTLDNSKIKYELLSTKNIINKTTKLLCSNKTIGWFQDRMEFGPRALGHRSIIGDPRSKDMQKTMNIKIKFRESFRPFAPSVLANHSKKWFNFPFKSPYMLFVGNVNRNKRTRVKKKLNGLNGLQLLQVNRSLIPAVTHVDYSARIQTVDSKHNKKFF